jgi:tripartite-type tricarboxylate transporter receptor subunit TctC
MTLALERGEVEGRSTSNPQVLGTSKADIVAKYNFLIQAGLKKFPGYEEVPLLRDLATNEEQQRVFDFICNAVSVARPLVTNPGVPPDRVAALRRAFDATLADPAFLQDAARQNLEISARSGEELQKVVYDILDASPDLLEKIREIIEIKSAAEPAKGVKPGGGE